MLGNTDKHDGKIIYVCFMSSAGVMYRKNRWHYILK